MFSALPLSSFIEHALNARCLNLLCRLHVRNDLASGFGSGEGDVSLRLRTVWPSCCSFVTNCDRYFLEPAACLLVFPFQILLIFHEVEAFEPADCFRWQFVVYVAGFEVVVDGVVFDAQHLDQ